MTTVNELLAQRANLWEEQKKILDQMTEDHRSDFTAEEQQTWERLDAEMDQLEQRIELVKKHETRGTEIVTPRSTALKPTPDGPSDPEEREKLYEEAFAVWMRSLVRPDGFSRLTEDQRNILQAGAV